MASVPGDPSHPPALPGNPPPHVTNLLGGEMPDAVEFHALQLSYPQWKITRAPFGGYRAEHKSETGLQIRYVGGNSVADLASRLLAITSAAEEAQEGKPEQ